MWRSGRHKATVLGVVALLVLCGAVGGVLTYRAGTRARVTLTIQTCPTSGLVPGELDAFGDHWSRFAGPASSASQEWPFDHAGVVRGTLHRSWGASTARFVADDGRRATFFAKHHKLWMVGCAIS